MRGYNRPMDLSPMLATLVEAPLLKQKGVVYEPKYDGIRALVELVPGAKGMKARLWSRNGNEKTAQFPAIVRALEAAGRNLDGRTILDGEIVALDERGRPAGFQRLQGRMHLKDARDAERAEAAQPAVLIAFDILREDKQDLTRLPLTERRARLEKLFDRLFRLKAEATGSKEKKAEATSKKSRGFRLQAEDQVIRLSEQVKDDATAMHARAMKEKWEGLIAKDAASTYQPGRRSPAWRKIKLQQEQEFVIGGWTEPRQTRQYFGALLLGVNEYGGLKYAGHTGTGFDQKELARLWKLLKPRETKASPFSEKIKTNETEHWVRPDLVAQIRFTEWTTDGKLRHPVYLGLRDDKGAADVVRENAAGSSAAPRSIPVASAFPGLSERKRVEGRRKNLDRRKNVDKRKELDGVIEQLRALEDARKDGELALPNGDKVKVTNLAKLFWSKLKLTKGDLLRYYVEVSPFILPCVEDRPLVMKRFPNGVDGKAFYQQRSREERPPAGVRIETLEDNLDPISEPDAKRLIGGSLTTLLYMTQMAAISQDPWFSRVQSPPDMDHCAIDLDPTDGATFDKVLDVARWVRDELVSLGVAGFPKTSGASGLHIYIPLPPHTSYESGQLFCQIVATVVASRHPKVATVERAVKRRPRGTIYVDFLQNILGKTLATAYSARASDYAGVSTPLSWKEVDGPIDPRDFTIRTAPARFREIGDRWKAGLRDARPADLEAVFGKYSKRLGPP
jgi:bifunctional non-homologous end joining protein LigD